MQLNLSGSRQKIYGLALLLALVVIGLLTYKDYGVSWDENAQRAIGYVNMQYLSTGDPEILEKFEDRHYGASFELPLIWVESTFAATAFGKAVHLRHLITFLFYLGGIWCGYLLALRLFRKNWIALLGMAMLVLHPRIFAHAFFNSKDAPFLAAMLMSMYAVQAAVTGRRGYQYLLAGAACGFATGIRTMSVMLIGLAGILMLVDAFRSAGNLRKSLLHVLLFGLSAIAILYLTWPALRADPINGLFEALSKFSRYSAWDYPVTLNGSAIPSVDLPWYYAPEWFLISTPVLWILLGTTGSVLGIQALIRSRHRIPDSPRAKFLIICAALFLVPLAAVILLNSVLYDDWRHLYFIYPPFVMMALYGVERLSARPRLFNIVAILIGAEIVLTTTTMVRLHPFEHVYFNPLVPHTPEYLRTHFDYEYWGTSHKEALAYLLEHDKRDTIPIAASNHYAQLLNMAALPDEQRLRIGITSPNTPGAYKLETHRFHPEDYPFPKVWSLKRGGSTVMQIYRIDSSAVSVQGNVTQ